MKSIVVDIDKLLFDIGLSIRKKTVKPPTTAVMPLSNPSTETKMVKLPKLDIPTFSGNILQWLTFWEQFSVAIHDRVDITKPQKMAYLRQALKHGSARNMVEGLSRTGEQYDEAIECLENRYNKPRLIHQAHVKEIIEVPSLRDNSAKEIRRLHDVLQQHLRALKAMKKEPSSPFITSLIEMKLDNDTRFEWQKHSQASVDVPDYNDLLEFLNLRAQAAESAMSGPRRHGNNRKGQSSNPPGREFSHLTHAQDPSSSDCVVCNEKHPLYACKTFKALSHDKMMEVTRSHNLCLNCLKPGHYSKKCTSLSKCRKCQRPHHTLLHIEPKPETQALFSTTGQSEPITMPVSNHAATGFGSNALLMTCQVLVHSPDGIALKARALLDSGSSTSFVSDQLVQNLQLPKTSRDIKISGIAGISHHSPLHSVVNLDISPMHAKCDKINVSAVIIPRVTSDLPQRPVHQKSTWSHLHELNLADPDFGRPGRIDILLGVDVYADIVLQGRRTGPPDAPVAFETKFGWVLAGRTSSISLSNHCVTVNHVSTTCGDELLSKFWEVEETPKSHTMNSYSQEERSVIHHFKENHHKSMDGRFVVPLPRKPGAKALGESRTQAVRRFLSLERSLHSKNQFKDFSDVIEEYFEMDHAEPVPADDVHKPSHQVFYLPMHAVYKESSTTTKIRAVFDASAKSSTGVSLNDTLMVGPTVHPPLIDVLIRFRQYRIALTADISKMYRAVELIPNDRDFYRFVWRIGIILSKITE